MAQATVAIFLASILAPLVLWYLTYYFVIDRHIITSIVSRAYAQVYSIGGAIINRVNLRVYENLYLTSSSSQIRLVHIIPGPVGSQIGCKLVLGDWRTFSYEALSYI